MGLRLTTHGLGTHGLRATIVWRPAAALLVAVALLAMLGATSASAVSPAACRVQNTTTGGSYTALQAAVDGARKGSHLTVKGTCHGSTVIDKDLIHRGRARASGRQAHPRR